MCLIPFDGLHHLADFIRVIVILRHQLVASKHDHLVGEDNILDQIKKGWSVQIPKYTEFIV